MRVVAIAAGHVGAPITVERKIRRRVGKEVLHEVEEVPADYIHPGDVFEWNGPLGTWMRPVEPAAGELDRKEITAKLTAAGIPFFKGATTEALLAMLPKE